MQTSMAMSTMPVTWNSLKKIGNRSGVLLQKLLFKETGQVAADALVTFVITDSSGEAVSMTGKILEEIEKLR